MGAARATKEKLLSTGLAIDAGKERYRLLAGRSVWKTTSEPESLQKAKQLPRFYEQGIPRPEHSQKIRGGIGAKVDYCVSLGRRETMLKPRAQRAGHAHPGEAGSPPAQGRHDNDVLFCHVARTLWQAARLRCAICPNSYWTVSREDGTSCPRCTRETSWIDIQIYRGAGIECRL